MIHRETGWVEVDTVASITAEDVAVSSIRQRWGVPLTVTSDRGSQFEWQRLAQLSKRLGFHRVRTTAYHPCANGKLEKVHRTLKACLKAKGGEWIDSLPLVLFAYQITPSSITESF